MYYEMREHAMAYKILVRGHKLINQSCNRIIKMPVWVLSCIISYLEIPPSIQNWSRLPEKIKQARIRDGSIYTLLASHLLFDT